MYVSYDHLHNTVCQIAMRESTPVRRGRAVQFTLQTLGEPWSNIPSTLLAMIPCVLAIVAMIALTSGTRTRFLGAPAALGIPYFREQR